MDSNTTEGEGEMVNLNVKLPRRLFEEVDEHADELQYLNRSEFVRDALRHATEPILTPRAREDVVEGYADVAAGRTMSIEEARDRLESDEN